jgi:hypothetical protein
LPYCNTTHASQGASIKDIYVIADYKCAYITTNWFYTAITRAINLNDIYFLDMNLTKINTLNEVKNMVANYKHQDNKKNRFVIGVPDDYITDDWILQEHRKTPRCSKCNAYMSFEKNSSSKLTVDRIDNNLAHIVSNCRLLCKSCNVRLKHYDAMPLVGEIEFKPLNFDKSKYVKVVYEYEDCIDCFQTQNTEYIIKNEYDVWLLRITERYGDIEIISINTY